MIGSFKPHMEILPEAQKQLWPQLKPAAGLGFVLYGGTAIALRLAHRYSVDFDFFSEKALDRNEIRNSFPFTSQATVLQDELDTFVLNVPSGENSFVKISFFGKIGFGRVGEPGLTEDAVLQVASLDDLMATKAKVILQRAEAKDYRDIAAMIDAGVDLAKGLAAARAMYGQSFQPSESLKAMVYFEDGDLSTLSGGEKNCLIKAVSKVGDLPQVSIACSNLMAM